MNTVASLVRLQVYLKRDSSLIKFHHSTAIGAIDEPLLGTVKPSTVKPSTVKPSTVKPIALIGQIVDHGFDR
jgi:hypothetical protein